LTAKRFVDRDLRPRCQINRRRRDIFEVAYRALDIKIWRAQAQLFDNALGDRVSPKHRCRFDIYFPSVDGAMAARLFALLMELKLYSREWCSWCIDAKDFLRQRGYKFIEIDIGKNRDAFEEMKELSYQAYVPTFVAGDKVLANFDTDQLEKFLSEHEIAP